MPARVDEYDRALALLELRRRRRMHARRERRRRGVVRAPRSWRAWLTELFPRHVAAGFATRHEEFWRHVWSITRGVMPRPFITIWARGGGKSTSAELACAVLGLRGVRRYALYVRCTQDLADKSVGNVAALLESPVVEAFYPKHASRAVTKFGSSKGWRRNRLMTAGGFTVDALGLDTAARGLKVEEQRPDLIIFDDLDEKHDTPETTAKKIATLTTSLLPAGSPDVAVLGIQNLIIPDGIFSRLADGRADFLSERIVSGPHPAVEGLVTSEEVDPVSGATRPTIARGRATWAGQALEAAQALMRLIGLGAFLKECQHEVAGKVEGLALSDFDERRNLVDLTFEEMKRLVALGSVFGGIDFGMWRFAFLLFAVDEQGVIFRIGEVFSQREGLEARARAVHDVCTALGCRKVRIWGDAANPTDIYELNRAWERGWKDEQGGLVKSSLRVAPVAAENKIRLTSVDRLNELYKRGALRLVRSVGGRDKWLLGYNAGSEGVEMPGSRLLWETKHWAFPLPREGEAQKQDPNDHTADGADAIAAERYAVMSHLRPGKSPEDEEESTFAPAVLAREAERSRRVKHRLGRRSKPPVDPHFGGS